MIKFYSVPGTSATVVNCALEELGTDYQIIQVERRNRDNPPEFKQVNPLGKVGAIDDDGVKVYETGAILLYLGDKYADKGLAPEVNSPPRADYYRWILYLANTFHAGYMPFYMASRFTEDVGAQGDIGNYASGKLIEIFDYIESELAGKQYLIGDKFSLADLYLHMLISPNWTLNLAEEVNKRPNLVAFYERINNRPVVQKVLEAHKQDKQAEQSGDLKIG